MKNITCPNCNYNIEIETNGILLCERNNNKSFAEMKLEVLSKNILNDGFYKNTYEYAINNLKDKTSSMSIIRDRHETDGNLQLNILKFCVCKGLTSINFDLKNHEFISINREQCKNLEERTRKNGKKYFICSNKNWVKYDIDAKKELKNKKNEILER